MTNGKTTTGLTYDIKLPLFSLMIVQPCQTLLKQRLVGGAVMIDLFVVSDRMIKRSA
jgi:hypothetical protein